MSSMTMKERNNYIAYLTNCTDRQVIGCYKKEKKANRDDYAILALEEAVRRGLQHDL